MPRLTWSGICLLRGPDWPNLFFCEVSVSGPTLDDVWFIHSISLNGLTTSFDQFIAGGSAEIGRWSSTNEMNPGYGPGNNQTLTLSYDLSSRRPDGSTTVVPGSLTVQVNVPGSCGL